MTDERQPGSNSSDSADHWILTLDTGSPEVSVALGKPPKVAAERRIEQARSSELLIRRIDEVLDEAGLTLSEISGIVALQGPGSFTGLRVGLATAMGMHQALGIPTTTLPTLEVLAAGVPAVGEVADGCRILAVVDALRDEWSAQPYLAGAPPQPLAPPAVEPVTELLRHTPDVVVGFGVERIAARWPTDPSPTFVTPSALAATAIRLLAHRPLDWDPGLLTQPLYLRQPAAVPSARRRRR